MVELSPKALRFAEAATRRFLTENPHDALARDIFDNFEGHAPETGQDNRKFAIPESVASLFATAIETLLKNKTDDDFDENDFVFLNEINQSIISDLSLSY